MVSKKEQAYEAIKAMLMAGKYKIGEPLVERQLCQRLGMSRTPVREALQALVSDGLLEMVEGKGVCLRRVRLADLIELFELRFALEGLATLLFVERATPEIIQKLREIYDTAAHALKTGDHGTFMDYDMKFHHYIAAKSRNTRLKQTIESNYMHIQLMAVSVREDNTVCRMAYDDHTKIMQAVEARDAKTAAQHMQQHIVHMKEYHQKRFYLYE